MRKERRGERVTISISTDVLSEPRVALQEYFKFSCGNTVQSKIAKKKKGIDQFGFVRILGPNSLLVSLRIAFPEKKIQYSIKYPAKKESKKKLREINKAITNIYSRELIPEQRLVTFA